MSRPVGSTNYDYAALRAKVLAALEKHGPMTIADLQVECASTFYVIRNALMSLGDRVVKTGLVGPWDVRDRPARTPKPWTKAPKRRSTGMF